jgi:hypothetical protein
MALRDDLLCGGVGLPPDLALGPGLGLVCVLGFDLGMMLMWVLIFGNTFACHGIGLTRLTGRWQRQMFKFAGRSFALIMKKVSTVVM